MRTGANVHFSPTSPLEELPPTDPIQRLLNQDMLAAQHGYPRMDEYGRGRAMRDWSLRANPNTFRVTRGDR